MILKKLQNHFNTKFNNEIGFSYIINKEGRMVFNPKSKNNELVFMNFYQYLIYDEVSLEDYVDVIMNSIKNKSQNIIKVKNKDSMGYIGHSEIYENSNWEIIAYVIDNGDSIKLSNIDKNLFISISVLVAIGFIIIVYILLNEINKQKEINNIYSIDQLTGIGNINKFISDSTNILHKYSENEYIVGIFDIKKLKYINYYYGASQGDKLLKKIAQVLIINFYGDETCARISGDKFIILAKNRNNFYERFKILLLKVVNDYENNTHRITFNYNFGFYKINRNDEDINEIIEKANIAWKYSKKEDNSVDYKYYNDDLLEYIMKEEMMENSMRKALLCDEFIVYMQPKINLKNNKICGAEALIRWISSDFGYMPPNEFIPLFERNGFIIDLDFFVLDEMFKFIYNRMKENKELFTVSINQSRETLRSKDYIQRLSLLIEKYNIPPELIEIEITESIFVLNFEDLKDIISEIRNLGIKISMDDFGAGYSSLNLLKEIDFDIIKLDRAFLDEVITSEKSKIIIKSIINMAKELNIEVVCEGVENLDHSNFLYEVGCTIAQGYFYGRPMRIKDFNSLLVNEGLGIIGEKRE